MWFLTLLSVFLTLLAVPLTENLPKTGQISQQVRKAIERGLPFMEEEVVKWNKRQNCVSCHNVLPILWSLNAARERGFSVDQEKVEDWTKKSWQMQRRIPDESLAYLILGRDRTSDDDSAYEGFAEQLIKRQKADGSWKPGGQRILQKRREKRSVMEPSLWSVLALTTVGGSDDRVTKSRARALEWFAEAKPVTTTEGAALQLLLESRDRRSNGTDYQATQLLIWQNTDGGWGWMKDKQSDVIATGQSLYALGLSGAENYQSNVRKAWEYLLENQRADGAWLASADVRGWSHDFTEQSVYWGTAWAILGLTQTLPKPMQVQK